MVKALYQKYRPKIFSDVTGQEHIKQTIQNQIKTNKVAHAYLFSGPRGVGKTTIARLLAKTVNCKNIKNGEPCNECENCINFISGKAIDIIEIDAASNTGVDNVRENIIEAIRFVPNQSRFKIFIIDEVHMLSASAFNALLKTLEEPPQHAIFVLATTEIHKIPATIISRCQRFDFHKINNKNLFERLKMIAETEKVQVDDEVYQSIIRISEGCARDAESLLGQVFAIAGDKVTTDSASLILPMTYISTIEAITEAIIKSDVKQAIDLINEFINQGGQMKPFLNEMIEYVRSLMMKALGDGDKMLSKYVKLLDNLLEVVNKNTSEAFPQLSFEIMVVEFCDVEDTTNNDKNNNDKNGGTSGLGNVDKNVVKVEIIKKSVKALEKPKIVEKEVESKPQVSPQKSEINKEASTVSFSIEDLTSKWKRCCDAVSKISIALPLVLNDVEPMAIYGNRVHIRFKKSFHFEMMSQRKNIEILNKAINEVMESNIEVMPIFERDEAEKMVGDLADAFGGVVV